MRLPKWTPGAPRAIFRPANVRQGGLFGKECANYRENELLKRPPFPYRGCQRKLARGFIGTLIFVLVAFSPPRSFFYRQQKAEKRGGVWKKMRYSSGLRVFCLLCTFFSAALGDTYMHNPRGSNNRLNERSANRNNANRLFNSQVHTM